MEDKIDKNIEDTEIELEEWENDVDDTELEDEEATDKDKIKKLREKLKVAEKEKMAALEDLARARAEFLNARRRLEEEKQRDRERAAIDHIEQLLPLCDSFSMALSDPSFQELPENLKKGVLGINMQLSSILKGYGVEVMGEVGEPFDPNLHEALADNGGDHKVSDVLQKGYKIGGKVIRPAKVIVG